MVNVFGRGFESHQLHLMGMNFFHSHFLFVEVTRFCNKKTWRS